MSKIFEQGEFAVSKAGHDKNHLYMIVNEDERYVYLVDGVNKTLEKPKKKNKKHIQIIHFCDKISGDTNLSDAGIAKVISDYKESFLK